MNIKKKIKSLNSHLRLGDPFFDPVKYQEKVKTLVASFDNANDANRIESLMIENVANEYQMNENRKS